MFVVLVIFKLLSNHLFFLPLQSINMTVINLYSSTRASGCDVTCHYSYFSVIFPSSPGYVAITSCVYIYNWIRARIERESHKAKRSVSI